MSDPVEKHDQRRDGRVPSRLPVTFGLIATDRSGFAGSLSESGLFISTNETYKVGTRLLVRIEMPSGKILNRGEVVWAIQVSEHMRTSMVCGMGIRFVETDANWMNAFESWRKEVALLTR